MFLYKNKTFGSSTSLTMVHLLVFSIFLLPMATASDEDSWDDVNMIDSVSSDPEDLPTQATTSVDQLVEQSPDALQHSQSSDKTTRNQTKRRGPSTEKFFPKLVTLRPVNVEIFRQSSIIYNSSSQDISRAIVIDKLLALGRIHKWNQLRTYQVHKYPKYWANVCVIFWGKKLDLAHRVACIVSRNYANNMRRRFEINQQKRYLDLLSCRCYTYLTSCKIPLSTPETFLIHKGNENDFFKFKESEIGGQLSITSYEDGITLTNPLDSERSTSSSAKFHGKKVTLGPAEIEIFNRAIKINNSYPKNVSIEELENKLMEHEEIHEWPDLLKYDYDIYFKYWANVCVYFWGKPLDTSHRQACILSPSLADGKIRKLYIQNQPKYYDLLYCKCHSYIKNFKDPVSIADTFLVHQNSADEFFVFEQRATPRCQFTLFVKDFKGGITLPNPDELN